MELACRCRGKGDPGGCAGAALMVERGSVRPRGEEAGTQEGKQGPRGTPARAPQLLMGTWCCRAEEAMESCEGGSRAAPNQAPGPVTGLRGCTGSPETETRRACPGVPGT